MKLLLLSLFITLSGIVACSGGGVLPTATHVSSTSSDCSTIWSNSVVFINESLTIPHGACLMIQDHTTVIFHTNKPTTTDRPIITINIYGSLVIGYHVVMQSLSFYNGNHPEGATSTDAWGFNILSNSTLNIVGTFKKMSTRHANYSTLPTFTLQQSTLTYISDTIVEGGDTFMLLRTSVNGTLKSDRDAESYILMSNSHFRNMNAVLDMDSRMGVDQSFKGNFGSGIFISKSEFENVENPITIFGRNATSQKVSVAGCAFRNIVRALYTNNPLNFESSLIENFSIGIQANKITVLKSTFTQTREHAEKQLKPCQAIVNATLFNNTGSYWIQETSFLGIYGVALNIQSAELLQINKCLFKESNGKDIPLIFISERADKVSMLQNTFNANSIPTNHLISFNDFLMFQFSENSLESNKAKSILNISPLKNRNIFIYTNIFDNYLLTEYEIYFSNPSLSSTLEKIEMDYNYWGTNKTGQGMSTLQLNEMIRKKVYPLNDLNINQIPYFLSNNTKDESPSNLGGIIPVVNSSGGVDGNNNDMILGAVLGSIGIIAFLAVISSLVVVGSVVLFVKKRQSKYLIIQH